MNRHFLVWKIFSSVWTESGFDAQDLTHFSEIKQNYPYWSDLRTVIYRDVLGYFALPSFCMLFVWIPIVSSLFLIAALPDWEFENTWLQRKMQKWYAIPWWMHYLNPLRWIGYFIAFGMAYRVINCLKRYYKAENI